MAKRKRYQYKPPYFVIRTDDGFVCYTLSKTSKGDIKYSLWVEPFWVEYESWYKDNYKSKREKWKPCVKKYYSRPFNSTLLKRKTKEPLERFLENLQNGVIKRPERFKNPYIVEVNMPFKEYVELCHSKED